VTVRGATDPVTGMVLDLAVLDRAMTEEIVQRFDHRHLNLDMPEYAYGRTVPTGEMLCVDIWNRLEPRLPQGCRLAVVRVQEDPLLYAEYRGEA
jgi:6-pyruvoyltetrahydropterin/6-carboxytetrahydropterin synthase